MDCFVWNFYLKEDLIGSLMTSNKSSWAQTYKHRSSFAASLHRKWAQFDWSISLLCAVQANLLRSGLPTRPYAELLALHFNDAHSGRHAALPPLPPRQLAPSAFWRTQQQSNSSSGWWNSITGPLCQAMWQSCVTRTSLLLLQQVFHVLSMLRNHERSHLRWTTLASTSNSLHCPWCRTELNLGNRTESENHLMEHAKAVLSVIA